MIYSPHGRSYPPQVHTQIAKLLKEGLGVRVIKARLGVSETLIKNVRADLAARA